MILDKKGDFYKWLEEMVKDIGCENDIIWIEVGGDNIWNLIYVLNIMVEVLVGWLVFFYENLKGFSLFGSD